MKKIVMTFFIILSFILAMITYASFQLGPKSDVQILKSIPNNLEPRKVLHKSADIWDGSCMTIAIELSDSVMNNIKENGTDFLKEISFSSDVAPLGKWQKTPFNNEQDYTDVKAAISCSEVVSDFKEFATRTLRENDSYYLKDPIRRTFYMIMPKDRLLMITHLD